MLTWRVDAILRTVGNPHDREAGELSSGGDFIMQAEMSLLKGSDSATCVKDFTFVSTKNTSGTGITIKAQRNSETRGVLIISDT